MVDVEVFLQSKDIKYILHEHQAVYTIEDVEKYCRDIPGLACKNLLLRDQKKRRYFLVVLAAHKRTDLKRFGETVGESKLTFASQEALMEKLGLEAGAVSPFGLLNDKNNEVEVYIDSDVYHSETVSFHPNRNTATLQLSGEMFRNYLLAIENPIKVIDL